MTDGAVDARLDFVFMKELRNGDTGCSGWGRHFSLVLFPSAHWQHPLVLHLRDDVSTLTHVFRQCTLPCDLWGLTVAGGHSHISFIKLSCYRDTVGLSARLTTWGFSCCSLMPSTEILSTSRLLHLSVTLTRWEPPLSATLTWLESFIAKWHKTTNNTSQPCVGSLSLSLCLSCLCRKPHTHTAAESHSPMSSNVPHHQENGKCDILVSQNWTLTRLWLVPLYPVHDGPHLKTFIVLFGSLTQDAVVSRALSAS